MNDCGMGALVEWQFLSPVNLKTKFSKFGKLENVQEQLLYLVLLPEAICRSFHEPSSSLPSGRSALCVAPRRCGHLPNRTSAGKVLRPGEDQEGPGSRTPWHSLPGNVCFSPPPFQVIWGGCTMLKVAQFSVTLGDRIRQPAKCKYFDEGCVFSKCGILVGCWTGVNFSLGRLSTTFGDAWRSK